MPTTLQSLVLASAFGAGNAQAATETTTITTTATMTDAAACTPQQVTDAQTCTAGLGVQPTSPVSGTDWSNLCTFITDYLTCYQKQSGDCCSSIESPYAAMGAAPYNCATITCSGVSLITTADPGASTVAPDVTTAAPDDTTAADTGTTAVLPTPAPPVASGSSPTPPAGAVTIDDFTTPSSTQKCQWNPPDNKCEMLWTNYPTKLTTSPIGKFKAWELKKMNCAGQTSQTNCAGAGGDCLWEGGKCEYSGEWDDSAVTGRSVDGCTGTFGLAPVQPCKQFSSESACDASAHCYWDTPDSTPAPTSNTPAPTPQQWEYSDDAKKCYVKSDTSSGSGGSCKDAWVKRLCGADSNQTMLNKGPSVFHAPSYIRHVCGTMKADYSGYEVTDDDAFKLCAEGQGMCSSMLDAANLPIVKKIVAGTALTATENAQWNAALKACQSEQFCDALAAVTSQGAAGSVKDCDDDSSDETACTAKGCLYLSAGTGATKRTKCISPRSARDDFDAEDAGSACYITAVQTAMGVAGLTDAALKTKMQEMMQQEIDCQAITDMASCTGACAVRKHTHISCDQMTMKGTTSESCQYNKDETSTQKVDMYKAYLPNLGQKDVEAFIAVDDSCKTNTDRASCEAAIYSATETAAVTSAEQAGVAAGASQIDLTKSVVVLLVGVFAASV